jgi:hypothetical protein
MGLLNKSNKTKITLTIGEVSDNIRTNIIQPNITSEQMDFCKELSNKVANLDVDMLYEKWDENIAPSLGLGYDKELYVTGGTSRGRYMLAHQIVHKNGSVTTYITIICFDKEMIKDIPIRTYQRMHTDGIKWIDDGVPNIFGINKIPVNTAYDVFRIE